MKKKSLLLMRVKGGPLIGMGHLYRTMAIAEAARAKFGLTLLFVRNEDPSVSKVLSGNSFESCVLEDLPLEAHLLEKILLEYAKEGAAACIMDSKEDLAGEILFMKTLGAPVLLLDNYTQARFHADVNIYPVAHFDSQCLQWDGYAGEHASGKDWVPLSQRFLRVHSRRRPIEQGKSLLVSMGGSDPNRLALKVMDALQAFRHDVLIRIVLGFSCQFAEEVHMKNKLLGNRFVIIERTTNIEELMLDAGLAITALGTTIYELAYLGVPTLVISNYHEDERDERELEKLGSVVPLGFYADLSEEALRNSVEALWNNVEKRFSMSSKGLELIDGLGAERIVEKAIGLINPPGQEYHWTRSAGRDRQVWE
jgi:UDP-2,4-diacetamido-2,4,6-trideoxy-beta-L-altropyranose hydrolase